MRIRRTFTKEFKCRVVEELLSGIATPASQCRKYNIAYPVIAHWKQAYADGKLDNEPTTEVGYKDKITELECMVGRLTMDNELLKKALKLVSCLKKSKGSSFEIISPSLEAYREDAKC